MNFDISYKERQNLCRKFRAPDLQAHLDKHGTQFQKRLADQLGFIQAAIFLRLCDMETEQKV